MKKLFKLFITLTSGIIIATALLFIAGYFGFINFYRPFVVLSGSMQPAIETGSVVFVLPKPFGYSVGDVITFSRGRDQVTTHRIVGLEQLDKNLVYKTQGDANSAPDSFTVAQDQVIGSVAFTVPYIGYLGSIAQKPQGFILLVIIPATIVVYEELKNLFREIKAQLNKLKSKKAQSPPVSHSESVSESNNPKSFSFNPAIALPIVGGFFVVTSLTVSFFQDTETSLQNILGASDTFNQSFVAPQSFEKVNILPTPDPTTSPSASPSASPTPEPTATESAQTQP
ncbi:signal peptidase I [Pseudomonadota bacterium]